MNLASLYLFILTIKLFTTALAAYYRFKLARFKTTETSMHATFFFAYVCALIAEILSITRQNVLVTFYNYPDKAEILAIQIAWALSFSLFLAGTIRVFKIHRDLNRRLDND